MAKYNIAENTWSELLPSPFKDRTIFSSDLGKKSKIAIARQIINKKMDEKIYEFNQAEQEFQERTGIKLKAKGRSGFSIIVSDEHLDCRP